MRKTYRDEISGEEYGRWPGGRLREAEKAAGQESKIKSILAMAFVILGMATFVYVLIKLPTGGSGSSGSGWTVECYRIGVRVVSEESAQPVENAQVAWWPPPKPERNPRLRSPVGPDREERPAPVPEKPKATGATGPNGQCVLSVTVWMRGGAGGNQDRRRGAAMLEGVLKVRARGFEPFAQEAALALPPDPKAPLQVMLKPLETPAEVPLPETGP